MADLRFNVDKAIERLQRDAKDKAEGLASYAAALEAELRAVAAALEGDGPRWDISGAAAFHVFDAEVDMAYPDGAQLEIIMYGRRLGYSNSARPLAKGRYRVLVQLTKIDDEAKR